MMRGHYLVFTLAMALLAVLPHAALADSTTNDQTKALAEFSKSRVNQLGRLSGSAPEGRPFRRVDGTSGYASVILPQREAPYTIPELAREFPESVVEDGAGIFLVKDDLIVGRGATLQIGHDSVQALRLLSTADRFITITSWRGAITVTGTAGQPISITSWDPTVNGPDTTEADGRAWIHTRRGSMSLTWAKASYLGFETGSLSGVAWEGREDTPSRGNVSYSAFTHNHFGAYTFEAVGMRWRYNTFAYNTGYGFDPHDHSDHFTVEYNRAFNNGTHGIIFSRGCAFNTIQFNESFNNGTHGIVLDDGPDLNPDGTRRERAGIPSDYNVVTANLVYGNEIGIVLDGGTGNTVSDNIVKDNEYGIRMKDAVESNTVSGNHFTDNSKFGIYLYNGSDKNIVTGNTVSGGAAGIVVRDSTDNTIHANQLQAISGHGIDLDGGVAGTTVSDNEATDVETAIDLPEHGDPNAIALVGNSFDAQPAAEDSASIQAPAARWIFWALLLVIPVLLGPWWGRLVRGIRSGWPTVARPK